MNSVWSESVTPNSEGFEGVELPKFDSLQKDLDTDVLIIGGGMAGIMCAYYLERAGVDYALVEAWDICSGVTKNTTAKITSQHGLIYDRLTRRYGIDTARRYLRANEEAVSEYREICRDIDCDFSDSDSYVYSLDSREKIEAEAQALERIGFHSEMCDSLPLPFEVAGAIKFPGQAQFNPLKFVAGVAKDLKIYEHTKVRELRGDTAVTAHGKIKAKRIIIATHFPIINKHGAYFIKMYQHRSYVLAVRGAPKISGMYVDENDKGMSFRGYKDLMLIGGGGHRTGKPGGAYRELEEFLSRYYPQAKIEQRWATQDCITLDGMPYAGSYSKGTDGLFVTTGFNKWGMTSSLVCAKILADIVTGRKNEYESLYNPSRTLLHPTLAGNVFESAVGLLTPRRPRCPHLGCALKWNSEEHSWDCPCHGSRFAGDGELLDGPATGDLNR